jgi:proline-specific peptidase
MSDTSHAGERSEGFVEVPGGRVWYARLGRGDATPLLLLHGGPGAAHHYLLPFAERMAAARPVVVYDQLGCGRSDRPDDTSLWTVSRSVEELREVRSALGLDRCHLFGQSWGGWLAIEYMACGATGIAGLVLASTSASIPQFVAEAHALVERLPEPHRSALVELGARGDYDAPEYVSATLEFYRRHLCRLDPWPEALVRSTAEMDDSPVYRTMNGPTEFDVIGRLRDWDRRGDLSRISVPTLVTCGRHDEITPPCSETITRGIRGARMCVFEQSAHVAHLEEPDVYAATVGRFLDEVDAADA